MSMPVILYAFAIPYKRPYETYFDLFKKAILSGLYSKWMKKAIGLKAFNRND